MSDELQVGQVLWLKVRYQVDMFAKEAHPMLIADIKDNYIEVIAIDKTAGKLQNLYYPYNKYINCENPRESVIYEDSYAQLNNKLTIEKFPELSKYRKTTNKLSQNKLNEILFEYKDFHKSNIIKNERIVHMTKKDILTINS